MSTEGDRTKWYGQNGTDKMVWTKWYTDKTSLDKMVYGQNSTDKTVASFGIVYNSSEINTYLVIKGHKLVLNTT